MSMDEIEPSENNAKKSLFHGKYKVNPAELLMTFKKNVRNKIAHGIVINGKRRWCDYSLQDVSILACEVIVYLGELIMKLIMRITIRLLNWFFNWH